MRLPPDSRQSAGRDLAGTEAKEGTAPYWPVRPEARAGWQRHVLCRARKAAPRFSARDRRSCDLEPRKKGRRAFAAVRFDEALTE
jgi:hypothetical protein